MRPLKAPELWEAPRLRAAAEDSLPSVAGEPLPAVAAAWRIRSDRPRNPRRERLAELVEELRLRFAPAERACHPTGLPELDAALGGGLAEGAVHELTAARDGLAIHTVAWSAAAAAAAAGPQRWLFYIDTLGDLYPPALLRWAVPLERLIIVRATHPADALWVMEQVLRCKAVAAAVLPLRRADCWVDRRVDRWCENPFSHCRMDGHVSRRLQLAAEAGGSLGLLLCREASGGATFAATRLKIDTQRPTRGRRCLRVTILKQRRGHPQPPFVVEIPDAAHPLSAPAGSVDRAGPPRRRASG